MVVGRTSAPSELSVIVSPGSPVLPIVEPSVELNTSPSLVTLIRKD